MSDALTVSKSWVQQFVDRAKGSIEKAPAKAPLSYVREVGSVAAEFVEGGAVGALLGATHAKFGLDQKGIPIDGVLAVAGALAGIALSGHMPGIAAIARRGGASAFTVLSFRKSYELVAKGPLPVSVHGGVTRIAAPSKRSGVGGSVDPIVQKAESLG